MRVLSQWVAPTGVRRVIVVGVCVVGAVSLAVKWTPVAAAVAVSDGECTVASLQAMAPKDTTIESAKVVPAAANLPEFCEVQGAVATPGNQDGFRLVLPVGWNQKFYFQGIGGWGGTFANMNSGISRKYASATTDMGHKNPVWWDGAWAATSLDKVIDFGHRGTHAAAVATEALTTAYYGNKYQHAYFSGCSTGGRSALMEAQRYPNDFDGIIGGDPGFGVSLQMTRQNLYKWMTAKPENYVPESKIDAMAKATLAECDAKDGLKDGLITDPRRCTFKPESMQCAAGTDGPDCFTPAQVETVKRIVGGLKTKSGEVVVPGYPLGHEELPTGWQQSIVGSKPPAAFQNQGRVTWTIADGAPNAWVFAEQHFRNIFFKDTPNYDWTTFDFDRDRAKVEKFAEILDSTNPDLRPFEKRNGKFILYHGWSDSMISAYWTLGYYEKVGKVVGGQSREEQFMRLFLVPGMHHCAGGPGPNSFDSLTALENWVEKGVAPDYMVASHATNQKVDRTRPVCAFPKVATYSGTGSIDDAASFKCEVPPATH